VPAPENVARCGSCHQILEEDPHPDPSQREPCPHCGATSRQFQHTFRAKARPVVSLTKGIHRTLVANVNAVVLPRQNDGTDRYTLLVYQRGRVSGYEMDFGPRVSATVALVLMRREMPPDAHIVAHAKKRTCEQIVYSSAMLKKALGSSRVGVEFSATFGGGRYRGVVGNVVLNSYLNTSLAC
jgi:hypothetical protein